MTKKIILIAQIWCSFLLCTLALSPLVSLADDSTINDLKQKIDERTRMIETLTKEIANYQNQIKETGKQASTLQSAISILDTTQKGLLAEMRVTETKIESAKLSIQKLELEIGDKAQRLDLQEKALAENFRKIRIADSYSLVESMLSFARLSYLWNDTANRDKLKSSVHQRIGELSNIKEALESDKKEIEVEHQKLESLKQELIDKKKAVEYNKQQKNKLLLETKNKEQNYKALLSENVKRKEAFERELFEFESQLKFEVDKSKLPETGSGILAWPTDKPLVTQYFGATKDAKRLYVSGTHNGIDLRATNGTPIKAALSGVVEATGNTDLANGCYSYGKWVLIKHGNGLSTLYAHLSVISVSGGQPVATGEIVGYSGATGYATGPHLHFGVYASQGVKVQKFDQGTYCKNVTMPVASRSAYLDPMEYLLKK
jgi:murein DD-endopeptidase MepM/ murein hydrolase activator NlpD